MRNEEQKARRQPRGCDLCKESAVYDLPIAIGLLMAPEKLRADLFRAFIISELSLDSAVRHTNGVLPMAALVPGLDVFPIERMFMLVAHLQMMHPIAPYRPAHGFKPEGRADACHCLF